MNCYTVKRCTVFLLALALLPLLSVSLAPLAEASYDGYYVDSWSDESEYGSTITYYRLYTPSSKRLGDPTFYSDSGSDVYNNIYTGWDVTFTFYRPYRNVTEAEAKAFFQYLLDEVCEPGVDKSAFWFPSGEQRSSDEPIFCYTIEGWSQDNPKANMQELLDRNPWMNANSGLMELEYIDSGHVIQSKWDYIHDIRNCSFALWFQRSSPQGGSTIGFRLSEGTEDTPVWKYCANETYHY